MTTRFLSNTPLAGIEMERQRIDCWTHAGMLNMNLTDSLTICSNLWSDWHIAPKNSQ